MKRMISIMLCMIMIFTSAALSVFAIDEPAEPTDASTTVEENTEEPTDVDNTSTEAPQENVNNNAINGNILRAVIPSNNVPFAITWEKILRSKVTLSWTAVEGATYDLKIDGTTHTVGYRDTEIDITDLETGFHTAEVTARVNGEQTFESATLRFEVVDFIDDVQKLEAMAGYNSVSVYFEPVEGAEKYIIARSTDENAKDFNADNPNNITVPVSKLTTAKEPWSGSKKYDVLKYTDKNEGTKTFYKVYAVSRGGAVSENSPVSADQRVQYIRYRFTLKVNKTLTSHNTSGGNKTMTFKAGTTLVSDGFGGGKYKFYYKIGDKYYYFYCNAVDCKNAVALYDHVNNYTRTEAENYVNEAGYNSATNYLIFAGLYCQHLYIFKGSKGKWECIRDFEGGSGLAHAATPSGTEKYILKGKGTESDPGRTPSRHGLLWWSPFSSWNAFHSKRSYQQLGFPASKGCIRMNVEDASFIYHQLPVYTKCVIL